MLRVPVARCVVLVLFKYSLSWINRYLSSPFNVKRALLFNLITVQPPRPLLPFASFLNSRSQKDKIMQFSFLLRGTAELFKSWLRSVLPYSCTIIKRSMLMINYAYRRVCRWTNVAHKEATYCTELMADWIRSSCIAICLQCFKQHCNPKSRSFPHDQQTALTSHKVNLHFGDMVPLFPAKLTCSDCFRHTAFQIDETGWWRRW